MTSPKKTCPDLLVRPWRTEERCGFRECERCCVAYCIDDGEKGAVCCELMRRLRPTSDLRRKSKYKMSYVVQKIATAHVPREEGWKRGGGDEVA